MQGFSDRGGVGGLRLGLFGVPGSSLRDKITVILWDLRNCYFVVPIMNGTK